MIGRGSPSYIRNAFGIVCAKIEELRYVHNVIGKILWNRVTFVIYSNYRSIDNPEEFWGKIAQQFHWETPVKEGKFHSYNFDVTKGDVFVEWMEGASTNISFNLLDRNVKNGNGDKIAFYW